MQVKKIQSLGFTRELTCEHETFYVARNDAFLKRRRGSLQMRHLCDDLTGKLGSGLALIYFQNNHQQQEESRVLDCKT